MALRTIIKEGDETLRKKTRPVENFDGRLFTLLDDMAETMRHESGCGLAANQVGLLRKVFIVDDGNGLIEFINPVIVYRSAKMIEDAEGCLSLPGKQGTVARPAAVAIEYSDRNGNRMRLDAEGYLARIICHENDHLDGILYTDYLKKEDIE